MGAITQSRNSITALQKQKEKRNNGAGHSKQPIKNRLQRAFRPPWARVERSTTSEPQQPKKLELKVTNTVTQERAPTIRAPSPLVSVETKSAVASGISGESMLRQPFFSTAEISGEPFTMSSTLLRSDILESRHSENVQSPPEVSPMSDESTIQLLANQPVNTQWLDFLNEGITDASPINNQITTQALASQLRNITPLDLESEHIAEVNRHESDPYSCHFCKRVYSVDGEPKVFLPCGHSFGVDCLYRWISQGLSLVVFEGFTIAHIRCPHDCINLRYRCGHLVTPGAYAPYPTYRDVSAYALPSAYEFCRTGRGSTLSKDVKRFQSIEKALMGDSTHLLHRGKKRKILDVLCFRRPPFSTRLLSMVRRSRCRAESDLYLEQKIWWLNEWGKSGHVNVIDSLFATHHVWEAEMRDKFLRDLELLGS